MKITSPTENMMDAIHCSHFVYAKHFNQSKEWQERWIESIAVSSVNLFLRHEIIEYRHKHHGNSKETE